MRIGGWRTRSVFERYAIVDQSDIADAMRKLETEQDHAAQEKLQKFGQGFVQSAAKSTD